MRNKKNFAEDIVPATKRQRKDETTSKIVCKPNSIQGTVMVSGDAERNSKTRDRFQVGQTTGRAGAGSLPKPPDSVMSAPPRPPPSRGRTRSPPQPLHGGRTRAHSGCVPTRQCQGPGRPGSRRPARLRYYHHPSTSLSLRLRLSSILTRIMMECSGQPG